MAGLSDYVENEMLDAIFNGGAWPFSTGTRTDTDSIFIALHTDGATPTDASPELGEMSGGGYARIQAPTGSWGAASGGSVTNSGGSLEFASATSAWGTVNTVSIWAHTTSTADGSCIAFASLSTAKNIGNGDVFKFNASQLTVSFD